MPIELNLLQSLTQFRKATPVRGGKIIQLMGKNRSDFFNRSDKTGRRVRRAWRSRISEARGVCFAWTARSWV